MLYFRSFPPSPLTHQLLIKHVALLMQAGPMAMGVIHKLQKMVTSQVSDKISEDIGLFIRGKKTKRESIEI